MPRSVSIIHTSRPLPAPLRAVYCDTFLCRLRGLMFRSRLDPHQGLLLVQARDSRPETTIHMLFLFMDLGVVWIDAAGTVVDTVLARAWHLAYIPRLPARYVLEIAPRRLGEFQIGDRIEFRHV
jgi:uncharacterized membrane protein (UPF0127 family)